MLPIKRFDVRINSSKCELKIAMPTVNETTFTCEDMDKEYTVNITVVDINGQRSNSTITEKTAKNTSSKHNYDVQYM